MMEGNKNIGLVKAIIGNNPKINFLDSNNTLYYLENGEIKSKKVEPRELFKKTFTSEKNYEEYIKRINQYFKIIGRNE